MTMRLLLAFALFGVLFPQVDLAGETCFRDLSKVEPQRKCRKQCDSDKDCKGQNKNCHCDNVCGKSCFNKDAECPPPPPFEGGNIIGAIYVYGATIEYVCDEGYILNGKATRSCRSDKKWDGGVPICDPACSSPPSFGVAFSAAPGKGFSVGTKVNYKCRFGYNQIGNTESECLPDFKWSEPELECVRISCGDPGAPANGYLEGDDFFFGSWVTHRCDKGFVIDDPTRARRHCSTTGKWSGDERTCSRIKCEQPQHPENGFVTITDHSLEFRSLVNYHCDAGFQLVGDSQGECNEVGKWGPIPTCSVDVNCNFDGISNALCGYTNEIGEWNRQFEQDNTLSGNPSYVLRALSTPAVFRSPLLISGEPHCFKFHYYIRNIFSDDSLVITTMNGVNTAGRIYKAEKKYRWLNQQISIMPIKIFRAIQYDISLKNDGTKIDFEDFSLSRGDCNTNCPRGTCLNGATCIDRISTFTCLCTRFFKGRNCDIEITCPAVSTITFGEVDISGDGLVLRPDTVVNFSCMDGYRLINGPSEIVCGDDGEWSNSRRPKCREILCDQPEAPSGGSMILVSRENGKMSIGSVVTFHCPIGTYLVQKQPTIVCQKDGRWSHDSRGTCKKQNLHSSSMECPDKYRKIDMMCFREYKSRQNYFQAASTCASFGGNLFILKSREEAERHERIAASRTSYHLGFDDVGRKLLKWSNGDKFAKISSERYDSSGMGSRKDITGDPRCGYFLRSGQTSVISVSLCTAKRRFVCQAFPHSIRPVIISSGPDGLIGIYRPVMGLSYMESLVYKMEGSSNIYLSRHKNGWTIGKFSVKDTKPMVGEDMANTNSLSDLPQNITDDWTFGSKTSRIGETIRNLQIEIFDMWNPWLRWIPCPVTCGGGQQLRKRDCAQEGGHAGFGDCKGDLIQVRICNTKQCIQTRWKAWASWGTCSKPCDGGTRSRKRECIRDPEGSEFCKGNGQQTETCNEKVCQSETSDWLRIDVLEYKIIYDSRSQAAAVGKCAEENGTLASIAGDHLLNFLKLHVQRLHCNSLSADTDWGLWAIQPIFHVFEGSGSVGKAEWANDTDSVAECNLILHQCGIDDLPWTTLDCNTRAIAGYICQRDWSPCNSQPCGKGGICTGDGEDFKCRCFENFQGPTCETEKRCNTEELAGKYMVKFADTMDTVQEPSVATDVTIHLSCRERGKGTTDKQTFKCIGLNQWDSAAAPGIKCESTCDLPELNSKDITAKHDNKVVRPGELFLQDTLLTFECPDMMRLVGEGSAECKGNSWDVELPTDCEFAFPCKKVTAPANGQLTIRPLPKFQSERLESGTKITLTCENNYVVAGHAEITCEINGQWSKQLGTCKDKQGCLLVISKLPKTVVPMEPGTFAEINKDTIFEPGNSVYLYCTIEETFKSFSCRDDNTWRPDVQSYCR